MLCLALGVLSTGSSLASKPPADRTAPDGTPNTADSAKSTDEGYVPKRESDSSDGSARAWTQLLLAMGIVVGLIFGLQWLIRRMAGNRVARPNEALKVVAHTGLSPKHQLFLVRMGQRMVLLGSGPQGLSRLAEITDPAEARDVLEAAGQKAGMFAGRLHREEPETENSGGGDV
jgi:flagellar protein FliO/FliZ